MASEWMSSQLGFEKKYACAKAVRGENSKNFFLEKNFLAKKQIDKK